MAVLAGAGAPAAAQTPDAPALAGLAVRAIGPAVMSGRVAALDAVAKDPLTIYVGTAGGGVWKSTDGGLQFESVFDDHPQSIGAVAVDPSSPDVVWVGTGESWVRNSVSIGAGVYRTTDGGESWKLRGLQDTERIARILVHPTGGDTTYACATGHLWDASQERGVFKTTDAGETWTRVLWVDENTGCSDLAMDPEEPRILYAGMWQFRRRPDFFSSGGPGSGLYQSRDGGRSWRRLEAGLPEGEKGRIAVAVAPSRPSVVYALVEAKRTALYRSEDLGESWTEVSASIAVSGRPFYFSLIVVDPTDYNRVYKPGLTLGISTDGGRTFAPSLGGSTYHSDVHALWVDPRNPSALIMGTDGGVYHSYDRGRRWRHVRSLPVSQFYEVSVDAAWPYNVYGGLQDNGSWMGPSSATGGVLNRDWRNVGFGDGFAVFPDPADPDLVYSEWQGGSLTRFRRSTGESKAIKPAPGPGEPALRFNWNTPVHFSPTRAGTMYIGAQVLFRSRDRGDSWERVSPDLTTNDVTKQRQRESGGLTVDNTSAENHTTIYTISESPLDTQVVWVGTDDGNLQVTRDGGGTWTNVAPQVSGLPAGTWVSHVEAGHHATGTAYATFDGHATGDMAPYAYVTRDFGGTWESLGSDSVTGYAHVIREDPVNPDLVFLGTELGLFVSLDGGRRWARVTGGLPRQVAVRDLAIHPRDHDLIIATHGRGLYVLDDLTPLRALTAEVVAQDVVMLPSRPAAMVLPASTQEFRGDDEFAGANAPEAARVAYYLRQRHMFGDLKVEVLDSTGALLATLAGGRRRGLNRAEWPMRFRGPKVPPATSLVAQPGAFLGPRVPEGTYRVRLTKGTATYESTVTLAPDPRDRATAEDRALQDRTVMRLYRMLGRLTYVVDAAVELRDSARARGAVAGGRAGRRATELADRLEGFRTRLVSTSEAGRMSGEERLRERLVDLYGGVNGYEGRPTDSHLALTQVLETELTTAEAEFSRLVAADLAEANRALERVRQAPLRVLDREEWERR